MTDRRADRILIARPRLHSTQRDKKKPENIVWTRQIALFRKSGMLILVVMLEFCVELCRVVSFGRTTQLDAESLTTYVPNLC